MDGFSLERICTKLDPFISERYLGTFAADTLPSNIPPGTCCILNTDPISEMGEHWVAVFHPLRGDPAEYFCSYGLKPPQLLGNNLRKIFFNLLINTLRLQSPLTTVCGAYCVYYLHYRCIGRSMGWIQDNFSKTDLLNNDEKVKKLLSECYNFRTPLLDSDFLIDGLFKK